MCLWIRHGESVTTQNFYKSKKYAVSAATKEAKEPRIFAEEAADLLKGVIGELVGAAEDPVPVAALTEGVAVAVAVGLAEPVGPAEPVELLLCSGRSTLKSCQISYSPTNNVYDRKENTHR